ncbi:MAG TPA: hypothetical protein VK604_06515 [Bryobacteraceae bacterium]|nr:hypothetical protein [Bryobacteraceae bacterium]
MRKLFAFFLCSMAVFAHPMGNFSVSHFSKLQIETHGVALQYVLDLAEIPTFELLSTWKIDRSASPREIDEHATKQAREWLSHLEITAGGRPVKARFEAVRATISDGAGNLPILRMDMRAHLDTESGALKYEDRNYPERAGWKEIVIVAADGVSLTKVSQSDKDLSKALTQYPADPTIAPPQDLRAELRWKAAKPVQVPVATQIVKSIPQPHNAPVSAAPVTLTPEGAQPGSVTRGDFLSRLLHEKELSLSLILVALAASFGLGAVHALTPGHGKAIVAAYLVGSRGTLKHAAFLGAMVTFTHTITVFALGLATLFLFRFIVPEKITVLLGALSGLSIVVIGAFMLYKRIRQPGHAHLHTHAHDHHHPHTHHHHGPGMHTHHSHVPEDLSWGGLVALGATGGLVPCESALVLLLGAIALGRAGLGLLLLLSFSLGLALVLMLIGVLVLYAKNLLPESTKSGSHPFFHYAGLASPAVVMVVGVLMTAASLGWIESKWMIG